MTHELKTWLEPYGAIHAGMKTHEVRVNDRDYKVGDTLVLNEWNEHDNYYTGRFSVFSSTYISYGGAFGLPPDLCVMSLMPIEAALTGKDGGK